MSRAAARGRTCKGCGRGGGFYCGKAAGRLFFTEEKDVGRLFFTGEKDVGRLFFHTSAKEIINLAVDGTEVGHHNRIPLWMFGLLY